MLFRLQLQIRSPLDQADSWTVSSTHMIFQIIRLDIQNDIWRERDR